MAAISSTPPYTAVGTAAKWCSPIHAVVNGNSDGQNNRCRFAHNTTPDTRWLIDSMWWWFQ